jgi:hypothetical protein
VDLDTTWYDDAFVALYPRQSGLAELKRRELYDQCERVRGCL